MVGAVRTTSQPNSHLCLSLRRFFFEFRLVICKIPSFKKKGGFHLLNVKNLHLAPPTSSYDKEQSLSRGVKVLEEH